MKIFFYCLVFFYSSCLLAKKIVHRLPKDANYISLSNNIKANIKCSRNTKLELIGSSSDLKKVSISNNRDNKIVLVNQDVKVNFIKKAIVANFFVTPKSLDKVVGANKVNVKISSCATNNSDFAVNVSENSDVYINGTFDKLRVNLNKDSTLNQNSHDNFLANRVYVDASLNAALNLCGAKVIKGSILQGSTIITSSNSTMDLFEGRKSFVKFSSCK